MREIERRLPHRNRPYGSRDLKGGGGPNRPPSPVNVLQKAHQVKVNSVKYFIRCSKRPNPSECQLTLSVPSSKSCIYQLPPLTYGQEYLIHIHGCLGRGLHEEEAVILGIGLRLLVLDHPFVGQVGLVAGQRDHDVRRRLTLQFLHPRLGARKRVLKTCGHYTNRTNGYINALRTGSDHDLGIKDKFLDRKDFRNKYRVRHTYLPIRNKVSHDLILFASHQIFTRTCL